MSSVNKILLLGHLGMDPEVRFSKDGKPICNFSLATNGWGENAKPDWHRVVVFGKSAEACGEHLKKGSQVFVEGRLQYNKWTDKNQVERVTAEVIASDVRFLSKNGTGGDNSTSQAPFNDGDAPF